MFILLPLVKDLNCANSKINVNNFEKFVFIFIQTDKKLISQQY